MDFKPPLTIEGQIEHIKNDKRVVFHAISEDEAKEILRKYGYINVITPFKYKFAKRDSDGMIIKDNGHHVYEREVDFKEYFDAYLDERRKYPNIYKNINRFETTFNAILSYECIHHYDLKNTEKFDEFIGFLQNNIVMNYTGRKREHMFSSVTKFRSKINDLKSIYIFMDRLTLNEEIIIFRNIDEVLQKRIFSQLLALNLTFNNNKLASFDKTLDNVLQIRNFVFHENSLTVLIRYFNIKKKQYRDKNSRSTLNHLIDRLSV